MARYVSGNNEPLTRWNHHPIYLTTILTGVMAAGLLLSAVLMSAHVSTAELFAFTMPLDPPWTLWRGVTYVFAGRISFFTPFSLLFFYWMGLGLETHLGRRVFSRLLMALVLSGPAICLFWWMLGATTGLEGSYELTCGLLAAFATLYPETEAWGWVPFKWVAFACIVCGSLMELSNRDWVALSLLWTSCAVGFGMIRHAKEMQYDDAQPFLAGLLAKLRPKPKFRVLASPTPGRPAVDPEIEDMDALLDKIGRSGMQSLSAAERARLDAARAALLRKDRR